MDKAFTLLPRSWSRERRSAVSMALAAAGLVVFLWVMAAVLALLPEPIGSSAKDFQEGAKTTVLLTVVAGLCGIVMGVLAALAKLSKMPPLRWISAFYIWVIRGTPLLVQILFVYFALPTVLPIELSDFNSAVIALTFNAGAYNAEAIRAGIQAVHKGQIEAARALGLTPFMTFRDVVFPQAFRVALPPLVNNFIGLLKDSSLAYSIGVVELVNIGSRIQAATFKPVPVLATVAVLYLILTTGLTQISNAIERQLDVERHH